MVGCKQKKRCPLVKGCSFGTEQMQLGPSEGIATDGGRQPRLERTALAARDLRAQGRTPLTKPRGGAGLATLEQAPPFGVAGGRRPRLWTRAARLVTGGSGSRRRRRADPGDDVGGHAPQPAPVAPAAGPVSLRRCRRRRRPPLRFPLDPRLGPSKGPWGGRRRRSQIAEKI